MPYVFRFAGKDYSVTVERKGEGYLVKEGSRALEVDAVTVAPGCLSLRAGNRSILAFHAPAGEGRIVCIHGVSWHLENPEAGEAAGGPGMEGGGGDGKVTTPMPGKIVAVHVKEGDRVEKGQALVVVESMKMQNDLCADVAGTVKRVCCAPGDQAQFGALLVEIEPAE